MQIRLIPPLLLFTLLLACEPAVAPISGPALVIDGDSLDIGETSVRLFGVDAFEGRQTCRRNGVNWRCGEAATEQLAELVGTGQLACIRKDTDSYGRTVARCTAGNIDLAEELARAGLALAYRQYSDDYIDEEVEARAARRGAWAGEFDAPWDWRRQGSRESAESSASDSSAGSPSPVAPASGDCPIKGNISREGERIYHVPGSPYYDSTVIDESTGERWLCSPEEAEQAGWRASRAR
jgi:endonuclease YncB( thermonuclease family)